MASKVGRDRDREDQAVDVNVVQRKSPLDGFLHDLLHVGDPVVRALRHPVFAGSRHDHAGIVFLDQIERFQPFQSDGIDHRAVRPAGVGPQARLDDLRVGGIDAERQDRHFLDCLYEPSHGPLLNLDVVGDLVHVEIEKVGAGGFLAADLELDVSGSLLLLHGIAADPLLDRDHEMLDLTLLVGLRLLETLRHPEVSPLAGAGVEEDGFLSIGRRLGPFAMTQDDASGMDVLSDDDQTAGVMDGL